MSKIAEVTAFMRDDIADMNKQAEELHGVALEYKAQFAAITAAAKDHLTKAKDELMELQAAMGQTSNFPPA